jgi:hypothetical protein
MHKDVIYPVYVGLSIALGIFGFIVISLLAYTVMPSITHLHSEFMAFMTGAGWLSLWIVYATAYSFAAYLGWGYLEKRLDS